MLPTHSNQRRLHRDTPIMVPPGADVFALVRELKLNLLEGLPETDEIRELRRQLTEGLPLKSGVLANAPDDESGPTTGAKKSAAATSEVGLRGVST